MIVDTSAIIAILRQEPYAALFAQALERAESRRISAANLFEAAIVMDGSRDPEVSRLFDVFIQDAAIITEPITGDHVVIARQAHRDYGKGSGHPAKLNFGDCFAYALATARQEPLLFKGNDFSHTDVLPFLR